MPALNEEMLAGPKPAPHHGSIPVCNLKLKFIYSIVIRLLDRTLKVRGVGGVALNPRVYLFLSRCPTGPKAGVRDVGSLTQPERFVARRSKRCSPGVLRTLRRRLIDPKPGV